MIIQKCAVMHLYQNLNRKCSLLWWSFRLLVAILSETWISSSEFLSSHRQNCALTQMGSKTKLAEMSSQFSIGIYTLSMLYKYERYRNAPINQLPFYKCTVPLLALFYTSWLYLCIGLGKLAKFLIFEFLFYEMTRIIFPLLCCLDQSKQKNEHILYETWSQFCSCLNV